MDDAFSYAERRLEGRGPTLDSVIDPKDTVGVRPPGMDPLTAERHSKVFTGIGWRILQTGPAAPSSPRVGPVADAAARAARMEHRDQSEAGAIEGGAEAQPEYANARPFL